MARKGNTPDQPSLFDRLDSDENSVVSLHEAARERYLHYALSVITSRALPDVRDGLKPVQRRILYTMGQAGMRSDQRHRKCAKVVGDVMGSYHPHGDMAIYDALVRMAQPFSLRMPLVDGSGNFGSLDGDPAAAMRYTECRLAPAADRLLAEIGHGTVDFRPNYDGSKSEPIVLPARQPNLLINGSTGIAVGMATNIPPHNPVEVCTALLKLLKNREMRVKTLCNFIAGPDFPTGARILNTTEELVEIYRTGQGGVRLRATHEVAKKTRAGQVVVITSVPYAVNKSMLVEKIADVVNARKLPPLVDVRDLSTEDVRIELLLKRDADVTKVLAYLYKHTPLQTSFHVNLTCLLPTANPEVGRPERCDLKTILHHFLQFRMEVVSRRLENELEGLRRRLHILEGFVAVFDALDEILKIIRASDGKKDAAQKIMKRFPLDTEQTEAILELKLYRLARLEINVIREELDKKNTRAGEIEELLTEEGEQARWDIVGAELREVRDEYRKDPRWQRRTIIEAAEDEPQFSAEDFIVAEDAVVLVTRDGWVKRQKEVRDPKKTKLRDGDALLAVEPGSTREAIVFFSNYGTAYTARIADIPATTGYGEPIQKRFKFKDGERLVAAFSLDKRRIGQITAAEGEVPAMHAFAATTDGYSLRFSFEPFLEPSTRNGRRFARPKKAAEVMSVLRVTGHETIIAASQKCRAMLCACDAVNFLSGPGKGVLLIKLAADDRLLGLIASRGDRDLLVVETNRGAEKNISTGKYEVTGRGGRGREIQKNGYFTSVQEREVEVPEL